jgi:hypothetical protein
MSSPSTLGTISQEDAKVLELIAKIKAKTSAGKLKWKPYDKGYFTTVGTEEGESLQSLFVVSPAPEATWTIFQVTMGKKLILRIDKVTTPLAAILGGSKVQNALSELFSLVAAKKNPLDAAIKAIDGI